MTISSIARHAAERPRALAVINNGIAIGYADLTRRIGQLSQALGALDLRPGQTIAIQCGDMYLHLLLLLGAERSGIVTMSFVPSEFEKSAPLFGQVDLVLTEQPARATGARRVHPITRQWVDGVFALAGPVDAPIAAKGTDGLRILRTSGTTGQPKRILLRRAAIDARTARWAKIDAVGPGHRLLIVGFFSVGTFYFQAITALRAGATLVFETRISTPESIVLHGVTHLKTLPLELGRVLDQLPADFVKPVSLSVMTIGGRLGPALRARAMAKLASRVSDQYGSNETGLIAERVEGGVPEIGTIFADVEVEVVDDQDAPVKHGTQGHVRVRNAFMADSYIDDPEATARMFRGGWFYPGDIGILHAPKRIEILGREDETMNLGGLKVLPETVEEMIRSRVALTDVAVCALPNVDGIDELWVAAVYDAPDDRDIRTRLKPAFIDTPYGHIHLAKLPAIPRTETGKIKRSELRNALLAAQAKTR